MGLRQENQVPPPEATLHIRASPLVLDENVKYSNLDVAVIVGCLLLRLKQIMFCITGSAND